MRYAEEVRIRNMVATTEIGQELELPALASDLEHARYDKDNFPGVIYRVLSGTALIFRSGKVNVTGARSREDIENIVETLFAELEELGIQTNDESNYTIQNLVTTFDLFENLNLPAIAIGLGLEDVEYEPEQFAGLIYRVRDPDVVMVLFTSGKGVITGSKTVEESRQAVESLTDELGTIGLLESSTQVAQPS